MYEKYLSREFLEREYVGNRRGCSSIADEIGCSATLVLDYLKKFGIKRRTRLEAISKQSEKLGKKKPTQTVQEAVQKLAKLDKMIEELKELNELQKALKGLPSNYYVSESEMERNRQKAYAEQRRKREKELKEDEAFERRKRGDTGDWHCGDVEEELAGILYDQKERI